jgi:multisubunit Na+/H+ antiporter MnhF subunit
MFIFLFFFSYDMSLTINYVFWDKNYCLRVLFLDYVNIIHCTFIFVLLILNSEKLPIIENH